MFGKGAPPLAPAGAQPAIPSRLRSRFARNLADADSGRASAQEMAIGAIWFYLPGSLLVLLAMVMPNSGVNRLPLGLAICCALVVLGALWRWGAQFRLGYFVAIVQLGSVLICLCGWFGGAGGLSITFLYVFCAIYSFYFFNARLGYLQLGVIALEVLIFPPPGSGWVSTVLTLGVCTVVGVWTKSAVDQVRKLARTDALTSLPNRRAWEDLFAVTLAVAARRGEPLSLAMIDLDHFKVFNDEHGHLAGDQLLQSVSAAWKACLRKGDVVARFGGEEFVFLMPGCTTEAAGTVVERLRIQVPRGLTCSAGLAHWDGSEVAEVLIHRADAALFEAKQQGRNRTVVAPTSDTEESSALGSSSRWAGKVVEVLGAATVDVAFQPVLQLGERTLIGYEALARPLGFDHRGSVEGFFVAASRMGKLHELDALCRQAAMRTTENFPHSLLLFVNISVTALVDPRMGPIGLQGLALATGHRPCDIVLEISERETVTNHPQLREIVDGYRERGFQFALDDVGEGHSTFETLAAVMPDFIKLAMSFTQHVAEPGPRAAIASTIVFAHETAARVIAEGIEDEPTVEALSELGVDLGQGYHLGRPEPLTAEYRSGPIAESGSVSTGS